MYSQDILNAIRKIVRALRISSRESEAAHGFSSAQLFVLQKLAEKDQPMSLGELAERTLTHLSSVSVIVSKLTKHGYLTRMPSPDDARRADVQLSAKGRKVIRETPPTAQEHLIAGINRLSVGERAQLSALLARVLINAGFSEEAPSMFFEDHEASADGEDHDAH